MPAPGGAAAEERVPLCVVGCGLAGVAALVEAARLGVPAVGLEAGPLPLASIHGHPRNLAYVSTAHDFELPGFPLDVRNVRHGTREEVLHYYARVVGYVQPEIRTGARWCGLDARPDGVRVRYERDGATHVLHARRAIVTAWYAPTTLPDDRIAPDAGVTVVPSLPSAVAAAGHRAVVFGGGISGFEQASALMLTGQRIHLLLRQRRPMHAWPPFARLLEATGSTLVDGVEELRVARDGVAFLERGAPRALPCTLLVYAAGLGVVRETVACLRDADVLDEDTADRLLAARSVEQIARREAGCLAPDAVLRQAFAERPDFWGHLFDGRRGVHLAGGVLHVGAGGAGACTSIATGILAARAAAGVAPPAELAPPLPEALGDVARLRRVVAGPLDLVLRDAIRPLRVAQPWAREWLTPEVWESPIGTAEPAPRSSAAPRIRRSMWDEVDDRVEALADGTRSLAEIGVALGLDAAARGASLRRLAHTGRLTWLPPTASFRALVGAAPR